MLAPASFLFPAIALLPSCFTSLRRESPPSHGQADIDAVDTVGSDDEDVRRSRTCVVPRFYTRICCFPGTGSGDSSCDRMWASSGWCHGWSRLASREGGVDGWRFEHGLDYTQYEL